MYDRTGLSTKCTLIKTGFQNLRTKFRPFVDALDMTLGSTLGLEICSGNESQWLFENDGSLREVAENE